MSFRERFSRLGGLKALFGGGRSVETNDVVTEEVECAEVITEELVEEDGEESAEVKDEEGYQDELIDDEGSEQSETEEEEEEEEEDDEQRGDGVDGSDEAVEAEFPELNGRVRLWIRDRGCGWIKGYIDGDGHVTDLQDREFVVSDQNLHAVSQDDFHDHSDAVELQNLHDAPVLNLIRRRFERNEIYTCVGSDVLLISLNPCQRIPGAYTRKKMRRTHAAGNDLSAFVPHVFSTADSTYRGMMREKRSQSVIISGDSGAGKTEAAKLILRYLAFENHYSRRIRNGKKENYFATIEERVVETNPILEAFGNAKTHLNHNSSRFGKLLQVLYDDDGVITGARIKQFLLEKSRVGGAAIGQRNFHIFYQLVRGATEEDRKHFMLLPLENYRYLSKSKCFDADGIDDAVEYQATCTAFSKLGFSADEIDSIFRLVSGILRLGNITFEPVREEESAVVQNMSELKAVAELFRTDLTDLRDAITSRRIVAGGEEIRTAYNVSEAEAMRDGLAKATYKHLFTYIVTRLNDQLTRSEDQVKSNSKLDLTICLLDQAGFEIFENNSLEQLLINFSNEKMQGQFHERISTVEKQCYIDEGVNWKEGMKYDAKANLFRVEALESYPNGVLEMLNEEGKLPRGSDEGLLEKLADSPYKQLENVPLVETSQIKSDSFVFNHFAGAVKYNTKGMIEKNKDFLHRDLEEVLSESMCPILSSLFLGNETDNDTFPFQRSRSGLLTSRTVWVEFKPQIQELMAILQETTPRYVRCVKPNDSLTPEQFDAEKVLLQLQYSGVLEFISVRRDGLPVRMRFANFETHYRILATPAARNKKTKDLVGAILVEASDVASAFYAINTDSSNVSIKWALGRTKVFMSDALHKWIEDKRLRLIHDAMVFCMNKIRARNVRRDFLWKREVVISIQNLVRTKSAVEEHAALRLASITAQVAVRSSLARKSLRQSTSSQQLVSTRVRILLARQNARMKVEKIVVILSSVRRGRVRETTRRLRAAVLLQSAERRRLLRRRILAFQKMKSTLLYGGSVRLLAEGMQRWKTKLVERKTCGAIAYQKTFRGWRARQQLWRIKRSIPAMRVTKMTCARAEFNQQRLSVLFVSSEWRRFTCKLEHRKTEEASQLLEKFWRAISASLQFAGVRRATEKLQRVLKAKLVREANSARACEKMQVAYRRIVARRQYVLVQRAASMIFSAAQTLVAGRMRRNLKRASPNRFAVENGYQGAGFTAIVLGPAGVGKTSVINSLLKERRLLVESFEADEGDEDEGHPGRRLNPESAEEEGLITEARWAQGPICFIDTEAVSDFASADMIAEELGDRCMKAVYIFVDKIDSPRTPRESLRAIASVFGRSVWQRTLFVFTNGDSKVSGLSFDKLFQRKCSLMNKSLSALGGNGAATRTFVLDNVTSRQKLQWLDSLDNMYTALEHMSAERVVAVDRAVMRLQLAMRRMRGLGVRCVAVQQVQKSMEQSVSFVLSSCWRKYSVRLRRDATKRQVDRLQHVMRRKVALDHRISLKTTGGLLQRFSRAVVAKSGTERLFDAFNRLQSIWRRAVVRQEVSQRLRVIHNMQKRLKRAILCKKSEFIARAAPNRFDNGPPRSFIICGPQGAGKSSLSQIILHEKAAEIADDFMGEEDEVGMDVSVFSQGRVTVYDTQSLGDVSTPESLCKALGYMEGQSSSTFIFVDRFDSHRLPRASLRAVSTTFGPRMWQRAIVVLTHGDATSSSTDMNMETMVKRKARAFNAAITSITAELADGDSLCEVPVAVVDSMTGRGTTSGMQAVSDLMDSLEEVSNKRIQSVEEAEAVLGKEWLRRRAVESLAAMYRAHILLSTVVRSMYSSSQIRLQKDSLRKLVATTRGSTVSREYTRCRESQALLCHAARRFAKVKRWRSVKEAVRSIQHILRVGRAKQGKALLLRASLLRFKAAEKSRRIGAVFFGPGGVGKSSLVNNLMNKKAREVKDSLFASLHSNFEEDVPVTPIDVDGGVDVRFYESFGISDTQTAGAVANELRDPLEHPLTSFVFTDRFDNHRVPKDTILAATSVFGPTMWNRTLIVLTHGDLTATYQEKIGQDMDLLELKSKAYNACINDMIAEVNARDSPSTTVGVMDVPVFIVDNTVTRKNQKALNNLANVMDILKKHAVSRSYLFAFQGINPSYPTAYIPTTNGMGVSSGHARRGKATTTSGATNSPHTDAQKTSDMFGGGNTFGSTTRDKQRNMRRKRKSHYDVLGIGESATASEVRRAYKDLAFRFHPDRNQDNPEGARAMFDEITDAYNKLLAQQSEAQSLGTFSDKGSVSMDMELSTYTTGFPVYIRTQHKRYWTIREGQEVRGICKERELSPLERFEIRWVFQGGFILRGHNGRVVTLSQDGSRLLLRNSEEAFRERKVKGKIPPYMFKLVFKEDGTFVILAANHKYIVAERGGWLRADRDTARAWETFSWRLAPSESGEEFGSNPLVVNLCGHTKKYVDVNPHESSVTCAAAHPATAERFVLEPVHGRLFRLRGSDGRILCVAVDGNLIMADDEDDDFNRIIRRAEFHAEFFDNGKVLLAVMDIREKLFIAVEGTSILLINRRRRSADLMLRICFEDTQMMRQLEFFSDEHLPWMSQKEEKEAVKVKPVAPAPDVIPTRFSMYRQF